MSIIFSYLYKNRLSIPDIHHIKAYSKFILLKYGFREIHEEKRRKWKRSQEKVDDFSLRSYIRFDWQSIHVTSFYNKISHSNSHKINLAEKSFFKVFSSRIITSSFHIPCRDFIKNILFFFMLYKQFFTFIFAWKCIMQLACMVMLYNLP